MCSSDIEIASIELVCRRRWLKVGRTLPASASPTSRLGCLLSTLEDGSSVSDPVGLTVGVSDWPRTPKLDMDIGREKDGVGDHVSGSGRGSKGDVDQIAVCTTRGKRSIDVLAPTFRFKTNHLPSTSAETALATCQSSSHSRNVKEHMAISKNLFRVNEAVWIAPYKPYSPPVFDGAMPKLTHITSKNERPVAVEAHQVG